MLTSRLTFTPLLSELGFAVQYFFSAPRYEDSLGYLPRQWVSVRPDNTDIIVRLVTRVALLLVIIHERVRFPLLELVLMFESSRVQVPGRFSDIRRTALIANIFVCDARV